MSNQVAEEIKVQEWVARLRLIVIVGVVVALAGGAYLGIRYTSERKSEQAFTALFQAEKIEEEALRAASDATKDTAQNSAQDAAKNAKAAKRAVPQAPESFYEIAKTWSEDKQKEYISKLQKVAADYSGTVAGALAGLRMGNFYFHAGKWDEANKAFSSVISTFHPRGEEAMAYRAMAFEGLGVVYEVQKKWDEAAKTFKEASELPVNPIKPLSLFGMARIYRAQGKEGEAKPIFERVIKEFPNTDYEKRARALMAMPASG